MAAILLLGFVKTGQLEALRYTAVLVVIIVFDTVGSIRFDGEAIRFRNWIRFERIPISAIESATVQHSGGPRGAASVVALKVAGRRDPLRIRPTTCWTQGDPSRFIQSLELLAGRKLSVDG